MEAMKNDLFWKDGSLIRIEQAMKSKALITGLVIKVEEVKVSGEDRETVTIDLGGIEAKCSDEEFDAHNFKTLSGFIGHSVHVIVENIYEDAETGKKIAIVSRKKAEEIRAAELLKDLKVGDIVNGTISGYNEEKEVIFINIGGVNAFCFLSDWDHIRTPSVRDVGVRGTPVTVKVVKLAQDPDWIIRVSRRDASEDPWKDANKLYSPGTTVLGVVNNVDPQHGIFVKIKRGVTILATVPSRSSLAKPIAGQPVRGVIKWMNEEARKGKMIITSYPHGNPNKHESPGSYLFN